MHSHHVISIYNHFGFTRVLQRSLSSFSKRGSLHAVEQFSGTVGFQKRSARMVSSAASRPTDVDLVKASVERISAGRSLFNLVDIGINLADSSYDKVRVKSPHLAVVS